MEFKIFGRNISATILTLLAIAVIGSAAVLTYYATIEGTITVEQAILVDGNTWETPVTYVAGACQGGIYESAPIKVTNLANNPIDIEFVTTSVIDFNGEDASGLVAVQYYAKLELENKDLTTWQPIVDNKKATLQFELSSPAFNYELNAEGLTPKTEYSLIYYADKPDRFVNWGGNNPGALLATGQTDKDGNLVLEGSTDIGIDLPSLNDWNIKPTPNYCNNGIDNYLLCSGAKIWLVPSNEYNMDTKTISWANPSSYLFETDLITYDDTDNGIALSVGQGSFDLYVRNTFASNAAPGIYTITTQVQPVV